MKLSKAKSKHDNKQDIKSVTASLAKNLDLLPSGYLILKPVLNTKQVIIDFRIAAINELGRVYLGFNSTQSTKIRVLNNLPHFFDPQIIATLGDVFSKKNSVHFDHFYNDSLNKSHFEVHAQRVEDHLILNIIDLKYRQEKEKKAKKERDLSLNLLKTIQDPVFVYMLSDNGFDRFAFVNNSACQFLKFKKQEELLQLTPEDISAEEITTLMDQHITTLLEGSSGIIETNLVANNGETLPVEARIQVISLDNETGFINICRDIRERKAHEEQLLEKEKVLQDYIMQVDYNREMLEEQSALLANMAEKLAREKQNAEDANNAKSHFIANFSHELRTPLNAIIGFSEILQNEILGPLGSPKYQEYSKDIADSGKHLLKMINELLDLSKIEAGKQELEEDWFEVSNITDQALRLIKPKADKNNIKITKEYTKDLKLYADSQIVKKIVLNLLSNAVKFTPKNGKIDIKILTNKQRDLIIKVIDNGIGIAKENLSRVMEPYQQDKNPFVRKNIGTGLGLPLCKSFVELHQGHITLSSDEGKGTTASITFPKKRVSFDL